MRKKYTLWTKDKLENVVSDSYSIAEVLKKLGLRPTGGNYSNLKRNIKLFGLNITHFVGQAWNKGLHKPLGNLKGKAAIRKCILKEVGYKCEDCGLTNWRDKPLTLELEHIDGDSSNNSRENLKILCPNCHSQTDTFRNRRRYTPS
jgi:ssDNA-binding Zn-finger/Zn-ribbon topoisomerase 1